MRLLLKLLAAVALAIAMQWCSARLVGLLDEAQFATYIYFSELSGTEPDAVELVEAAGRLKSRQQARAELGQDHPAWSFIWADGSDSS